MKYVIDIDGILFQNGDSRDFESALPIVQNIERVRQLWKDGHHIVLHTSRLERDRRRTIRILHKHGIPYQKLVCNKPTADVYVDDKAELHLPHYGANVARKPLVICYSGGMDSVIAYWYAIKVFKYAPKDIMLLNFDLGNNYAEKEAVARRELGLPHITLPLPIVSAELGNATTKDKYIIPGRNMVFASIAAGFGERVWIIGVKFEDHALMYDKNGAFYRAASIACSQAVGATTVVESPFQAWTKTEMIAWAMENGLEDQLKATVSCYHDTLKRCGDCGLCFKRAIAMYAAGRDERAEYAQDPFQSATARHFEKEYRAAEAALNYTHYSKERIDETLRILNHVSLHPSGVKNDG